MHQVIIIGAGPAAIAAAIQLKRFGVEILIIEKDDVGGLLKNANMVENYPGFPEGISGGELVELMKQQLEQYNPEIVFDEAVAINYNKVFEIKTTQNTYYSRFLIVATGTKSKQIAYQDSRIFYEVKHLSNVTNKEVAIIGAGDAAFDYAMNFSKRNNKIKIFNRSSRVKAIPLLLERAKKESNITYFENFSLENIESGSEKITVTFKNNQTQQTILNDCDYLLVAIGREQNDVLLTKELKENSDLFIIGDVKNGILRQTAVATGDGLKAATQIYERITRD